MRIYIGYKYRYHKDKNILKSDLQNLSDFFESLGHTPFILGRDVQKWEHAKYPRVSTVLQIIKHINKHDVLFVYLNSSIYSNGLPVEILLAKLYGLKIIIARQNGINSSFLTKMADTVVSFDSLDDLKISLKSILA